MMTPALPFERLRSCVGQVSGWEARLVRRARNQGLSWAGFAPDEGAAAVVMSNTARSVDRLGLQLLSQCRRGRI